ncbi:hypothetical protein [Xanthomarina spongicola]|uniref:Uncharacterized protein n=1 Tax=Xanthomarina spongicola TaxID=570520 RepID=A0A316E3C0_9FLAO|nr:hypothetical protein [Xanthomarina spongicola]PWK17390.1 hypothetical protein LX78_02723 [Xanthomarina spongicola]
MKNWFKNLVSISLILIYSLSLNIPLQDFLINQEHKSDISIKVSDSKTPVFYLVTDLEPLGDVVNDFLENNQTTESKTHFQYFKNVELYTLTKDNQYLNRSKNIQPGLDIETLLYPFHTFS